MSEFPGGLVVKDLALSLLWLGFYPWPVNFYMSWVQPKKKKKREREMSVYVNQNPLRGKDGGCSSIEFSLTDPQIVVGGSVSLATPNAL